MHKINKSLKIIGVLFLLAAFWLFYFVLQIAYGTPENANQNYIPKNAHLVVAFDGDLAIKSVFSDFISSQDQELLNKMSDSKEELKKATGINILSDFILFTANNNGTEITGLIFNLTSERDFKFYFSDQLISSNSTVGILLLADRGDKNQLRKFAASALKTKNTLYAEKLAPLSNDGSLISIWTKETANNKWNCSNVKMENNAITFEGTAAFNNSFSDNLTQLKSNNSSLHISSNNFLPKSFNDSLSVFLEIDNNPLIGVSVNYRSLKIEQENSFKIVPDADFVLQFLNTVDIKQLLDTAQKNNLITDVTNEEFIFGEHTFHYNQLNSTTLYIGRSTKQTIEIEKNNSVFSIHGAPKYLSKIEGSPLIIRLIEIFPAFRIAKGLSTSIKNIDVTTKVSSKNKVEIKGEIEFQKGKYASIELIKTLMDFR